jgi:hypothetical protein
MRRVPLRLWKEKRGELDPKDISGELVAQLGVVTEGLNRSCYERNSGRTVVDTPNVGFITPSIDIWQPR